jgi:lipopolysaccharide assembly outer membrane protein LptD (OstA)
MLRRSDVSIRRQRHARMKRRSFDKLLLSVLSGCSMLWAAEPDSTSRRGRVEFPGRFRLSANRIDGAGEDSPIRAVGDVELETDQAQIFADELTYDGKTRQATASGSVVLKFQGASLAGARLVYNTETNRGEIVDVTGFLSEDNALIRAARVERIDQRHLRIQRGVFTTCTQPVPYWSFYVGDGVFELGEYARMKNVAFRIRGVPVFYSPYLVYPIKSGRASGLMFPELGNSDKLGRTITVPWYLAVRDNVDLTLLFSAYARVGVGVGANLEMLPTWNGRSEARLRFINDQIRDQNRWNLSWNARQPLGAGFRMVARVEVVSDFDYFTDYESDLLKAALPQTNSTIDLTRQWSWYSLSLRARRQEQFFTSSLERQSFLLSKVDNQTLPEIEWRGRSQRIGRSPLYWSFQSSLDRFSRHLEAPPEGQSVVEREEDLITTADNDWWRADLAPTLTAPLVREPWGDLELSFGWRGTYYSAQVDPTDTSRTVGERLTRSLARAGVSFSGPRFQRVFLTPDWDFSPKLKHVVEPFVSYQYRPQSAALGSRILRVDSVDDDASALSDFSYGVRQRLFALRAPDLGQGKGLASARETSFEALEKQAKEQARRDAKQGELARLGIVGLDRADPGVTPEQPSLLPVEVASLEISQSYSLVRPLSNQFAFVPCSGGGAIDPRTGRPCTEVVAQEYYSPVRLRFRYNPTQEQVVDASYIYDPANERLTEASISTLLRPGRQTYVDLSWFKRQPANPALSDPNSYAKLRWGWLSPEQRFSIETDWSYDLQAGTLDNQQYNLRYATQCCSFRLRWERRNFLENEREEYTFVVDLSGVGTLIDYDHSN